MTFHAFDTTDGLPDIAPLPEGVEAFGHLADIMRDSTDAIIIHGEAAPTIAEMAEGHEPEHIGSFENAGRVFFQESPDGMSAHAQAVLSYYQ